MVNGRLKNINGISSIRRFALLILNEYIISTKHFVSGMKVIKSKPSAIDGIDRLFFIPRVDYNAFVGKGIVLKRPRTFVLINV